MASFDPPVRCAATRDGLVQESLVRESLLQGIAKVYAEHQRATAGPLAPRTESETFEIAARCFDHFEVVDPEAVSIARLRYRHYKRLADYAEVDQSALASRERPLSAWLGLLYVIVGMALGFPLFLFGLLTSYVPHRAAERVARSMALETDEVSPAQLLWLWRVVLFGLFWGALTLIAILWSESVGFSLFFLLMLPLCGLYARFYDRRMHHWRKRLGGLVPALRPGVRRVARARAKLIEYVDSLVALYCIAPGAETPAPRPRRWVRRVPWRAAALVLVLGLLVWFSVGLGDAEIAELQGPPSRWSTLSPAEAEVTLEQHAETLVGLLDTLDALEDRMAGLKSDFESGRRRYTDVADNREVRQALGTYLSCRRDLFEIVGFYRRPDRPGEVDFSARAFLLCYTAAIELYHRGMGLIMTFEKDAEAVRKLNEADSVSGLRPGIFNRVRRNLANADAYEELARAAVRFRRATRDGPRPPQLPWSRLWDAARAGEEVVARLSDQLWHFKWDSAVARATSTAESGRYGASEFFAGLVGGVRVRAGRLADGLISPDQVAFLRDEKLQPGDILIERRNWALSNVFLPGFWTHAALYVGGREGLRALGIEDHEAVQPHLGVMDQLDVQGHPRLVLEALAPRVLLSSLEHSVGEADAVCIFRPRLSREEVAQAVLRALAHRGKPYDFDFDFFSSDKLVCTELIHEAYQGPIHLELQHIMGRDTLPALAFVQKWAREREHADAELDLIYFLDAFEDEGVARVGTPGALIESLDRSGMTILQGYAGSSTFPRALLITLCVLLALGLLFLRKRA